MNLTLRPEEPLESGSLGIVPIPFPHTLLTLLLTRTVIAAARLGIVEVLGAAPPAGASPSEVALRAGTHPVATGKLLEALVGCGYADRLGDGGGDGRYALSTLGRKWLLPSAPQSLHESLLYRALEWEWIGRLDDFVRSGEPLRIHDEMTPEEWQLYQGGMATGARFIAPEIVRRIPVPPAARDVLDIGGSHGLYSVALCKRHPALRAVVLDLPEAIAHAAPVLAAEKMGDRVVHRAGDALRDDLGESAWDVVMLSNLAHHFDEPTNRELVRRIARALRPGGVFVLHEIIRPEPGRAGQIGPLIGLYFALTSESGTFTFEEMATWQRDAGLAPQRPLTLPSAPGFGLQIALKPT